MDNNWNDLQDTDVATLKSAEGLFTNALSAVLAFMGITTFIMILVGGFKYLTAGDDPKKAEVAQSTLTSGIVGLALTILAFFILLAIQGFTGVNLSNFSIGL